MARNKYDTHIEPYLDTIRAWRARNIEIVEICKRLNVGKSTFFKYQKEKPELAEAMRNGYEEVVALAENTLYKRMKSHDERISLDAAKFFLTHRCGYMTEAQRENININRQRMENSKKEEENRTQVFERILGGDPTE